MGGPWRCPVLTAQCELRCSVLSASWDAQCGEEEGNPITFTRSPFFHPPMSLVADYIDLFPILFGSNHLHSCHSQCLSCVRLHNEKDDAGLAVKVVLATLPPLSPRWTNTCFLFISCSTGAGRCKTNQNIQLPILFFQCFRLFFSNVLSVLVRNVFPPLTPVLALDAPHLSEPDSISSANQPVPKALGLTPSSKYGDGLAPSLHWCHPNIRESGDQV